MCVLLWCSVMSLVCSYDLAELHLKLKQHAKAAKVLNAALEEQHCK